MEEGKHSSWVSMHYHRPQPLLNHRMRRLLEMMESAEEAMEFLARGRDVDPTAGLVDSALHSIKAAEEERARKTSSIQSWLMEGWSEEGSCLTSECSEGREAWGADLSPLDIAYPQCEDGISSAHEWGIPPCVYSEVKAFDPPQPSRASSAECRLEAGASERMRSYAEETISAPSHSSFTLPDQRPCSSGGGCQSAQSPVDDVVMRLAPAMVQYFEDGVRGDAESKPSHVRVRFHERAWRRCFSE
ncbi:hypothetical protein T484DRAFT_1979346 [Baffinella frigidus]|nr:hypothetical protein T484DRAFT_1979346 [Cryptophyta sp. CCMP2293]|mmetsp:Transcript_3328/g.7326  ORF Transcript_3328/g.7326 Transcript_3328/m.7326 type:complete len:245 (-) Transcript_3328:105-839(-)